MKRFEKHKKSRLRKQLNEKNDCAVIAFAIVMRTTYKAAHELCASIGRRVRGRTYTSHAYGAIAALGFVLEPVANLRQASGSRYTPKTIGDKLKRGYYLCYCNGHVFAVVNGTVEDWTQGRRHHITSAYKVTRTRG